MAIDERKMETCTFKQGSTQTQLLIYIFFLLLNNLYELSYYNELDVIIYFTYHLSQGPVIKTETMSGI